MRQISQALSDAINNWDQHFGPAELVTFYFASGTQRWTAWGQSLTTGGNTWTVGPGLKVGDLRFTGGIATDTLAISVFPDATTIGGLSMQAAARTGLFDNVRVTVALPFMLTPSDASVGAVTVFDGFVSQTEPGSTEIRLTCRSLMERLSREIPSRTNMPQCPYRLFSASCGVTEVSHARTVAAGSTATVVNLSASSTYAEAGGRIVIGGVSRMVRSVNGVAVTVMVAFPATPATEAAVTVYPGCDKLRTTCGTKYSNLLRFGGLPDTPKSEVA